MSDTIRKRYCFSHGEEVKRGKRACEYRLIWEREVLSAQIGECDMHDALVIRADQAVYQIDQTALANDLDLDQSDIAHLVGSGVLVWVGDDDE